MTYENLWYLWSKRKENTYIICIRTSTTRTDATLYKVLYRYIKNVNYESIFNARTENKGWISAIPFFTKNHMIVGIWVLIYKWELSHVTNRKRNEEHVYIKGSCEWNTNCACTISMELLMVHNINFYQRINYHKLVGLYSKAEWYNKTNPSRRVVGGNPWHVSQQENAPDVISDHWNLLHLKETSDTLEVQFKNFTHGFKNVNPSLQDFLRTP